VTPPSAHRRFHARARTPVRVGSATRGASQRRGVWPVSARMTRRRWLRARRRILWREILCPLAERNTRLRWWGETASRRARSGRQRSGSRPEPRAHRRPGHAALGPRPAGWPPPDVARPVRAHRRQERSLSPRSRADPRRHGRRRAIADARGRSAGRWAAGRQAGSPRRPTARRPRQGRGSPLAVVAVRVRVVLALLFARVHAVGDCRVE
jgi:hypothetical protein